MPKIRNISGQDRTISGGRLCRADEVIDVPDASGYVIQTATWEAVEPVRPKPEHDEGEQS